MTATPVRQQRVFRASGTRRKLTARELPAETANGQGYIYVIEFDNGTVKVGRGDNARHRVGTQLSHAWSFGLQPTQGWTSALLDRDRACEKALLWWTRRLPNAVVRGNEWFSNVVFDDVLKFARRMDGAISDDSQTADAIADEIHKEDALANEWPAIRDQLLSIHDRDHYWTSDVYGGQAWPWLRYLPVPRLGWDEETALSLQTWCEANVTPHETWLRAQDAEAERQGASLSGLLRAGTWEPTYPDPGHPPCSVTALGSDVPDDQHLAPDSSLLRSRLAEIRQRRNELELSDSTLDWLDRNGSSVRSVLVRNQYALFGEPEDDDYYDDEWEAG